MPGLNDFIGNIPIEILQNDVPVFLGAFQQGLVFLLLIAVGGFQLLFDGRDFRVGFFQRREPRPD